MMEAAVARGMCANFHLHTHADREFKYRTGNLFKAIVVRPQVLPAVNSCVFEESAA